MRDSGTDRPQRRRTTIENVRIHFRAAGRGKGGLPVVCIADPGDSSAALVPLLRALGEQRPCLAVDLPGHGRSGNPPYGRRDPGWWLLEFLDRVHVDRCHLLTIGSSIGVATDACQRAPQQIASLVAISPPPAGRRSVGQALAGVLAGAPAARPSLGALTGLASRVRSAVAVDFRRAMHPRDLERELGYVQAPVLVVRGEADHTISREQATSLSAIASGTYVEIPGAPRACHRSHAAALAGTLECFWPPFEQVANGSRPRPRARMATARGDER